MINFIFSRHLILLNALFFLLSGQFICTAQNFDTSKKLLTEVSFNFQSGVSTIPIASIGPSIKLRYIFSKDIWGRVALGGSINNRTLGISKPDSLTLDNGSVSSTVGVIGLVVGIERHLSLYKHLSPYFGAECGYGIGFNNDRWKNTNNGKDYYYGVNRRKKQYTDNFVINFVLGFDYFVSKNFFLGGEIGLNFVYRKDRDAKIIYSGLNMPINNPTPVTQNINMTANVSLYAINGIRVGFSF